MSHDKIYTGIGDNGFTSTASSAQIPKSDDLIACLGEIDELQAVIGVLRTLKPNSQLYDKSVLEDIQKSLVVFMAVIAEKEVDNFIKLVEDDISELERLISLSPLNGQFAWLIPGRYNKAESQANLCRTVCRRAERQVVAYMFNLPEESAYKESILMIQRYLNRLSDFFYCLAYDLSKRAN